MAAKNLSALGVLYTDRRIFYLQPNVVSELWPSVNPFTTIASNQAIVNTPDPDFKMFEHRSAFVDQEFQLNDSSEPDWASNGDPGATLNEAIKIDGIVGLPSPADSSYVGLSLEVWDATKTTYKGVIRVQSVASGELTCVALGNPRAVNNRVAALANNDFFLVIGPSSGEGQTSPEAWSDELSVVWNSTTITRTPIEVTGTLYEAALRGYSNELARLRMEKMKEHNFQREKKFLRGVRLGGTGSVDLAADNVTNADAFQAHINDADGKVVRETMGMIPAIYRYGTTTGDKQNIFTIDASSYEYDDFVDDTEKTFQYLPNNGELTGLVGPQMLSYFSKVGTSGFIGKSGFTVNVMNMEKDALGFSFRRLVTPHGTIKLVYAPALRGVYKNTMLLIDPAEFKLVQYRAAKYSTNIKTDNGYDGIKDELFNDDGVGTTLIEKHSIWTLDTSGS